MWGPAGGRPLAWPHPLDAHYRELFEREAKQLDARDAGPAGGGGAAGAGPAAEAAVGPPRSPPFGVPRRCHLSPGSGRHSGGER